MIACPCELNSPVATKLNLPTRNSPRQKVRLARWLVSCPPGQSDWSRVEKSAQTSDTLAGHLLHACQNEPKKAARPRSADLLLASWLPVGQTDSLAWLPGNASPGLPRALANELTKLTADAQQSALTWLLLSALGLARSMGFPKFAQPAALRPL